MGAGGRHYPPHASTLPVPKLNFLELRYGEVRRKPLPPTYSGEYLRQDYPPSSSFSARLVKK